MYSPKKKKKRIRTRDRVFHFIKDNAILQNCFKVQMASSIIIYKLKVEIERKFLSFPKYCHVRFVASTHFHLPFPLFNSLSLLLKKKKKKKSLSHGCSSTSPLHLPLSPSNLLNSLTSSSLQLIISHFHLSFSPSYLLNSLNSSSPQLITPQFPI